ncbi:RNA binding protein [Nannochloropsis gaditana]|uniref:RNA binding protein n=1 Tax=Nannochloropsis gaditana TaxID=72520 RepID=W7TJH0_9STRA|nr:RNA binding protein [Nannochloropsis gaditana]
MALKAKKPKDTSLDAGGGKEKTGQKKEVDSRLAKPVKGVKKGSNDAEDRKSGAEGAIDGSTNSPPETFQTNSADFVALSDAVKKKMAIQAAKDQRKEGKAKARKAAAAAKASKPNTVIYLGHVPHGFFEDQMRAFFGQFGDVKHIRLSRSKKTGKSRGYAFLEFAEAEVASVVAETMQGYYLGGRKLVCEVLPPSRVHPKLFLDADKKWRVIPWRQLEKDRRTAPKTEEEARKCLSRLVRGDNRKRKRLAGLGIQYDFPGYEATASQAYVKRKKDDLAVEAEKSEGKSGAGGLARRVRGQGGDNGGGKGKRRMTEPEAEAAPEEKVKGNTSSKKKAKVGTLDDVSSTPKGGKRVEKETGGAAATPSTTGKKSHAVLDADQVVKKSAAQTGGVGGKKGGKKGAASKKK